MRKLKSVFSAFLLSIKTINQSDKSRIISCIVNVILGVVQSFVFGVLILKVFFEALFEKQDFTMTAILIASELIWQIFYSFYKQWYANIYIDRSNTKIQESVYQKLFDKTVLADMQKLESPDYFDTFRMVIQNSVWSMISIVDNVFSYAKNIILLLLNGLVMVTYEPWLIIFIILSVICSYFSNIMENKYRVEKNKTINPLLRKYDYVKRVFYSYEHAPDVKSTKIYDVLINTSDSANIAIQEAQDKYNKKIFKISSISNVISVLLRQIPNVWICAKAIISRIFTSGDIAVTISAVGSARNALQTFLNLYPQIQENCIYVSDFVKFMEIETDIKPNEEGEKPEKIANAINIKNISFSYGGGKKILQDISMDIHSGEKIAIVGRNGAGKTTLVKLILQLYKPDSGTIEMDGKFIEKYNLKEYRERFGVAFQDTRLYSVSVAENVLMDKYDSSQKNRVLEALKRGRLLDRVSESEKGIDSTVTKEFDANGIEFSGGQAQKLALSRVIAHDAGVVILDEPSAALDPISEAEMYESMLDLMDDKTVILISHRLSACKKVDKIYVIDDGIIAEKGTHAELLQKGGLYAEMWQLQASGYIDS